MRIAVVDIETTARFPNQGTIVEVGICELDLDHGYTRKLLDTTVREKEFRYKYEKNIVPSLHRCWVFMNSNLTVEEIENGPTWEEIKPKIQEIFNKYPATAYNKSFDFGWFRNRGIKISKEIPDPMLVGTSVLKIPSKNGYDDYKWPSVQESWDYFFPQNKIYNENHRAYDDCVHEARIVLELYRRGRLFF